MTGWMRHKPLVSVLMLCCTIVAQADQKETEAADVDEAFLLFLADWEDEEGNWQDPLTYDDPKWDELDNRQVHDDE